MDLFIMRHGQAHPAITDDASRELTTQGIADSQIMARAVFLDKNIQPVKIISSCYTRAIQTADAVAGVLAHQAVIPTTDQILPDSDPRAALDFIAQQTVDSLLLVSHQPLVGLLISLLVEGVMQEQVIPTSAIAHIKINGPVLMGNGYLQSLQAP